MTLTEVRRAIRATEAALASPGMAHEPYARFLHRDLDRLREEERRLTARGGALTAALGARR